MKARHERNRIQRIKRMLIRLLTEAGITMATREFKPGMVLGLSYLFGSDAGVLAEVSGYDRSFCAQVIQRCRSKRIWRGDSIRTVGWDQEYSTFAFWLDVMTAAGTIDRVTDPKVRAAYMRRRLNLSASACTSCGQAHGGSGKVCERCKDRVKASQSKRKRSRMVGRFSPARVACDPYYAAVKDGAV